ncbi:DUF3883 domain-containing protein [Aquabacterium sp. NJ1]|uniref:DUF3883 domain-containing protein n=1 Tax=Aquabacterium sp. NJ1 TaxID=1538295 RepID=UPI001F432189|nr:DUF3883 domain-containing protein [Aquabacterium sp. NJ1]
MAVALNKLSRWAVEAAMDEFVRVGREAFLQKYHFGPAREFFVIHPSTGLPCDSKAVVGAAYGLQFTEHGPLRPQDFSGGQATVVKVLKGLGFELSDAETTNASNKERAWTRHENELIVADYLEMLLKELAGQKYNKADRARALMPLLNDRSKGSIEFKRANISAVMIELGFPSLQGYKPRANFQRDGLVNVVAEQVEHLPMLDKAAELAVDRPADVPESVAYQGVRSEPPRREHRADEPRPTYVRRGIKRDYFEREARNRSLGSAGERFIVQYEQWRLAQLGVGQLADRVEHVAATKGDGLGYDVLSFETDGRERFIEVKTTAHDAATPFFVSVNEVEFARERAEQFRLCRLYHFRTAPKFFELSGAIEQHCHLDPSTFKASF